MQDWLKISLLLCGFGFLKEFRPSEHYIYDFLKGPWRNITEEEINQKVYPVATYSYLTQLIIVFLITDLCRYKPLIIVLGISGIAIFSMLLWTTSLEALQGVEVLYGTLMATEIAYYTYMYAKVPKEYYQQVTGHTRAGILLGRFLSGGVAQLIISFKVMNVRELTYISLGALILATIWSFLLPSVKESIYFNRSEANVQVYNFTEKIQYAFQLLYQHFISSFSDKRVIKWSIWWAMATCGFIQVQTYMQPLWSQIQPMDGSGTYNGAVEAVLTLFGTLLALVAGSLKTDWILKGELVLAICSIIEGAVLLIASQTTNILICYACYIVFGALFHFMITIASAEIAKHIADDSFGLVFGLNTFFALVLQTILTVIVVSDDGFAMEPRHQYLIYGGYYMVVATIFIIVGIVNWFTMRKTKIPYVA